MPPAESDRGAVPTANNAPPAPPSANTLSARPPAAEAVPPAKSISAGPENRSASVSSVAEYTGPRSGTLESNGGPIPQNAEWIFRNLPAVKMQLDYDTKIWDARLAPGEGGTQRLILKNKSSGPQKRCVVHWSLNR